MMAIEDLARGQPALGSAIELSAIYAETADELRITLHKPGLSRDQLARLVVMASVQLDGASAAIDKLARVAGKEGAMMSGEWDRDRATAIRRARVEGFLLGVGSLGCCLALLIWAIGA